MKWQLFWPVVCLKTAVQESAHAVKTPLKAISSPDTYCERHIRGRPESIGPSQWVSVGATWRTHAASVSLRSTLCLIWLQWRTVARPTEMMVIARRDGIGHAGMPACLPARLPRSARWPEEVKLVTPSIDWLTRSSSTLALIRNRLSFDKRRSTGHALYERTIAPYLV